MITQARIEQELRGIEGLEWIGALRSSQIAGLLQEGAIAASLFDEKNLAEISSPDFPNERLIACRNPFLAQYRSSKREALLRATEVELQKIALATKREKRALRGKAKIALRVGRLIERFKMAKHFVLEIEEDAFGWKRNEPKIAEEALLDGMYVVRTSVDQSAMSASEAVVAGDSYNWKPATVIIPDFLGCCKRRRSTAAELPTNIAGYSDDQPPTVPEVNETISIGEPHWP